VEQLDLLRYVIDVLERLDLTYAVVGSFASYAYGEPRFTQDIDIVLRLERTDVVDLVAAFPDPEFYLNEAAVRDFVNRRVPFNVLHPASGNKIDFMPSRNDAWGRSQFDRRVRLKLIPDREAYVASAVDIIVSKLCFFAEGGSDKHLRDIAGILKVSPQLVDRAEVARWATELGVMEPWNRVVAAVDSPRS
jgi:hypothetical protein